MLRTGYSLLVISVSFRVFRTRNIFRTYKIAWRSFKPKIQINPNYKFHKSIIMPLGNPSYKINTRAKTHSRFLNPTKTLNRINPPVPVRQTYLHRLLSKNRNHLCRVFAPLEKVSRNAHALRNLSHQCQSLSFP